MRKEPSRAVALVGVCCLLITLCPPSWLFAQGTAPKPEYFGFYALDGGKLIAIGGGKSDTPATLQQVSVATLDSPQASRRSAVQLAASAHFLLFDVSPADAGRAISVYRLPFVRNEVTVPDVVLPGSRSAPTARPRNLPAVMRLAGSEIHLLQKPVAAQPQMIELVPDPQLVPGLYGVLYAPAAAVAMAAGDQNPGWVALLMVGDPSASGSSGQCIDLILMGGLGGMIGADPVGSGTASFPLLDPRHVAPCAAAPVSSTAGATPPPSDAELAHLYGKNVARSPGTLADLEDQIDAGKEVTIPIRLDSGVGIVNMVNGLVKVTKTTVSFSASCCWQGFALSPEKILEMTKQIQPNQREQVPRLHVKVAITNKKGKEVKEDFYFYNAAATAVGGAPNGQGASIGCSGCDDSIDILYALLMKVRAGSSPSAT